jgi:hypothetical protein
MDMDISTLMMICFIVALILGMWKVYAFMPNKVLEDDDTTEDAQEILLSLMLETLKSHTYITTIDELYVLMIEHKDFNNEKFWRFNKNKLKNILELYYIKNPNTNSISDIIKNI